MKKLWIILLSISTVGAQSLKERLAQATTLEEKKQYEEAASLYKEILNSKEINRNNKFDIYLKIADLEMDKLGRPDSSLKYLELARKEYSDAYRRMDEVFYRLGVVNEKLGNYQAAAEHYQTVAVKFQKSKYLPDVLDGVERVFRKNFQDYVAFVGEEPITRLELEREFENIPPFAKAEYETEEGKQKLLKNIIQRKLLVREAENRKLYLKSSYLEEMQRAREQALIRTLYNEIAQNISVDEKEIKDNYEKNKEKYKLPATVTYKAVIVENKAKADSVYLLLKRGVDFDTVFAEYNIDAQLKTTSGIRKNITQGTKPEEVVNVAFSMKEGEISKPIKIEKEGKYAVIQLVEKKPEGYRTLDEVKDGIKRNLENEKMNKAWNSLLDTLWNKYNVRIMYDEPKE